MRSSNDLPASSTSTFGTSAVKGKSRLPMPAARINARIGAGTSRSARAWHRAASRGPTAPCNLDCRATVTHRRSAGVAEIPVHSSAPVMRARELPRRLGTVLATSLVVSSMIGAGVFTTTGKLLVLVPSPLAILACWLIGGVAALCGALAYAELASALADNGGEYQYLSRLFHPAVGFVTAWTSLVVGFAAPLAALALAFGSYLRAFLPGIDERAAAAVIIVVLTVLHSWRVSAGAGVQIAFTAVKVLLVLALAVAGLAFGDPSRLTLPANLGASPGSLGASLGSIGASLGSLGASLGTTGFAAGVLWVSFAYTGWNASTYVAGEIRDPARSLPRALIGGTLLVTVLYVALNAAFLVAAPAHILADRLDVAEAAATYRFGLAGGRAVSVVVLLGLVSTIGALVVTGPRIYESVGRDYPRLAWLSRRTERGGPLTATWLQSGLALVMLAVAGFEALLTYIGFTLSLISAVAVAGVFVLRHRRIPSTFRTPGYPLTPALFIALMLWSALFGLIELPLSGLAGLATLLVGLVVYRVVR
ncbi:MAG: amino acid permease [Myxococcales bacterium]|nr:amino acid permease [Myxococcales bacterium]